MDTFETPETERMVQPHLRVATRAPLRSGSLSNASVDMTSMGLFSKSHDRRSKDA